MTEDAREASLQEQTPEPARIYQLSVAHRGFERWKPLLLAFVTTRLGLAALTLAVAIVTNQPVPHLWNHWDGNWYVGIAAHGYHWSIRGKPAVAFFPLYPLLIHVGIWLSMELGSFAPCMLCLYLPLVPWERWKAAEAKPGS